jgi:hypothetical protein
MPMQLRSEQYRRIAGNCLRRAGGEPDPGRRAIYVTIAQACHTLADRAEGVSTDRSDKKVSGRQLH